MQPPNETTTPLPDTDGVACYLSVHTDHLSDRAQALLLADETVFEIHTYAGASQFFLYVPTQIGDSSRGAIVERYITDMMNNGEGPEEELRSLLSEIVAVLQKAHALRCRYVCIGPDEIHHDDLAA